MTNQPMRWLLSAIVAAAVAGAGFARVSYAQERPGGGAGGGEEQPGEGDAGDPDKPEQEKPKDPSDLRNAIGNLDLVRNFNKLSKPLPPGEWQQLVNLPYYSPSMKARKLLFHGQYE
jgi:hypothetical protein